MMEKGEESAEVECAWQHDHPRLGSTTTDETAVLPHRPLEQQQQQQWQRSRRRRRRRWTIGAIASMTIVVATSMTQLSVSMKRTGEHAASFRGGGTWSTTLMGSLSYAGITTNDNGGGDAQHYDYSKHARLLTSSSSTSSGGSERNPSVDESVSNETPPRRVVNDANVGGDKAVGDRAAAEGNRASKEGYGGSEGDDGSRSSNTDQKETVLVTGVAGYVGSHTALRLLDDGHSVIGLDDLSRGSTDALNVLSSAHPESFTFEKIDIGDADAVNGVFARHSSNMTAVIHLAAVAFVGESVLHPELYRRNVTDNTRIVVDAMLRHDVTRLVFASSSAVYGTPAVLPATEDMDPNPLSPYGRTKLDAERYILSKASAPDGRLSGFILRYFNVIGADSDGRLGENPRPDTLRYGRLWTMCLAAQNNDVPCLHVNDGRATRDFVHVEDVALANVKAMSHSRTMAAAEAEAEAEAASTMAIDNENGQRSASSSFLRRQRHRDLSRSTGGIVEIINVASNVETSLNDFVQAAEQVTRKRIPRCDAAVGSSLRRNNNSTAHDDGNDTADDDDKKRRRGAEPSGLYGSTDKMRDLLGWAPERTDLTRALETAWMYTESHSKRLAGEGSVKF